MNVEKINNIAMEAESRLGSMESNDPMYDYTRGYLDGVFRVMNQLGYHYTIDGFRRVRDGRKR